MTTQIHPVQLQYSHTIGRAEFSGPGFRAPVGIARGADKRLYVLNRSYEGRPDGKRITICTVGEEYIAEFGRGVSAEQAEADAPDGCFMWPTSLAPRGCSRSLYTLRCEVALTAVRSLY